MNLFKKLFGKKVTKSEGVRRSNLRSYSNTVSNSNTSNDWVLPAMVLASDSGYSESTRHSGSSCSSSNYSSSDNYSSSSDSGSSSSSCD